MDRPRTDRHAVQQQCSRCVFLCVLWAEVVLPLLLGGASSSSSGSSRRSRKRPFRQNPGKAL